MCSVVRGEDHSLDKYLYALFPPHPHPAFPGASTRILFLYQSDCQLNLCIWKDRLFSRCENNAGLEA